MANKEHLALLRQGVDTWNCWRQENPLIEPDLSKVNLSNLDREEINLSKVNLSQAILSDVFLPKADLRGANLKRAILEKAWLNEANLSHSNLVEAEITSASLLLANLYAANLQEASLRDSNLAKSNLIKADLTKADLLRTDFRQANLTEANLSSAFLYQAFAYGATFKSAILTGACIDGLQIDSRTNLNNVVCEYIYLKTGIAAYLYEERRSSSGNFAPEEFTLLFQKASDTVDLIFADGIDWKAFFQSFQELRSQYDDNISIQAIEKKSGGAFVIRLEIPPEANKAAIESQAKELYERDRQLLEAQYRERLNAKDNQIEIYKQQSASMEEIAKLLATRPIKFKEPKVTLQPTQIKILQAIQDGMGDSDSVAIAANLSTDTVEYYLTEMNRDGYVRYFPSLGEVGSCNLTSKGRVALADPDLLLPQRKESSVNVNQTFNNHLSGANIANFANQVRDSASQNASQFSQAIGQNADELIKLIATLRETAQTFPAEQQEEALGHLDDLQEDLSKPERQEPSRIKRRLKALMAIVLTLGTMAAGTVDFTNNLTDLAEKLGVPIELNQSPTPQQLPSAGGR